MPELGETRTLASTSVEGDRAVEAEREINGSAETILEEEVLARLSRELKSACELEKAAWASPNSTTYHKVELAAEACH